MAQENSDQWSMSEEKFKNQLESKWISPDDSERIINLLKTRIDVPKSIEDLVRDQWINWSSEKDQEMIFGRMKQTLQEAMKNVWLQDPDNQE